MYRHKLFNCAVGLLLAIGFILCNGFVLAANLPVVQVKQPTPYPGYLTDAPTLDLAGTVSGHRPLQVTVSDQHGGKYQAQLKSAKASGVLAWHVNAIPLKPGVNVLQIKATDRLEQSGVSYITVTRSEKENAADLAPEFNTTIYRNRVVKYQNAHGRAIVEGDIDIGPVEQAQRMSSNNKSDITVQSIGIAYNDYFWPTLANVVQIPYTVSNGNANVPTAITQFNATFNGFMQWVPLTAEIDYVDFNLANNDHSGSGFSSVGRVGGAQQIGGSIDMTVSTLLHEMGHTAGLYHEQSRSDRDAYITLLSQNIIKSLKDNFSTVTDNVQSTGLYDYASIMHYPPFNFSKNGEPTLESIPAGMLISQAGDFSAGDIDGIKRLYKFTPGSVTITSNPPGLLVIVDGSTITTPQTFNFALNSVHTLDVPGGSQALSGTHYTYGRWNDNVNRSHTINIVPGNGLGASPTNKPAVTVYQANFIELVPYAPTTYPASSGSITATPMPASYPPASGLFYVKRQPVTLKATANAGYSLYRLYTAYGPVSQSTKTTRNPDWVLAYFTPQNKITVTTAPAGRWIWVDGAWAEGPISWSPYYPGDGDWSAGTIHNLDVAITPQLPFSWSIRYPWTSWSDSGAKNHTITAPAGNATYTAYFNKEFNASVWAQQGCAGTVDITPSFVGGFYSSGSNLTINQTPNPGWIFTGWLGDLTGTVNPKALVMNDERLVIANYNTSTKPLAITALSPATKLAGQPAFTLTITGTGFTANSRVFINDVYRPSTFVSATQLKVNMAAADIQTAGAFQVYVDNIPSGTWPCAAYAARPFYVRSTSPQPLLKPAPLKLTFAAQQVGTQSPPQAITLTNSGTATLALHDLALTGTNTADFSYTSTCGSAPLSAGSQCTISVSFKPLAANTRSARLLILDTGFDSPQIVTFTGTGSP